VSKTRTEAFSDAVIAVAITLLALDLHVPTPDGTGSLAHRLGEQWPNYAAYVVSFMTIGIIWVNHHAMLRRLASVDHTIMMLNLVLLLTIGVLPFTTALMAEYLKAGEGDHLAAAVYGGSLLVMSLAFFGMHRYVLIARQHLLQDRITRVVQAAVLRRNFMGLLPYVMATVGAIISAYITLAICAAVAVYYALPGTTSDENVS
jgi:uncharacterized membrane protein